MPFLDSSSSGTLEAKYLKAKDEICYVSVLENINVLMFYKLIVGVKTVKFIVIKTLFNLLFLMRSLIFSIEKSVQHYVKLSHLIVLYTWSTPQMPHDNLLNLPGHTRSFPVFNWV